MAFDRLSALAAQQPGFFQTRLAPIGTSNPYDEGYALDQNRRNNSNEDPLQVYLRMMMLDKLRNDDTHYSDVPASTQRQAGGGGAAMGGPRQDMLGFPRLTAARYGL